MKVRVGQYGARMYYGIPQSLHSIGYLERLYTDFTVNKGIPKQLVKMDRFKKLGNRHAAGLPAGKIVHLPDYGFGHLLRMRKTRNEKAINEANFKHGLTLERKMMADHLDGVNAVCMIGSPSELIFKFAKQRGVITIMEQIIAPASIYLSILKNYLEPYADWEEVPSSVDSVRYWQDVSDKEWAQSDFILSGSDFVSKGLSKCGVDSKKIVTIPYGVPVKGDVLPQLKLFSGTRKLRVLFVGTVGVRKGIQYLLEIASEIKAFCEIKICGTISLKEKIVQRYREDVSFEGHVSRENIGSYYDWADVFVLPTLFEGSATVCYEAIQHGLPLVTTQSSGIFLEDGDGIQLIAEGERESLKNALKRYHDQPDLVKKHSEIIRGKIDFASMSGYQDRIKVFFRSIS